MELIDMRLLAIAIVRD